MSSTPSRFFNDCVDLEGGAAFSSGFGDHGTASADEYPNSFAYAEDFGIPQSQQVGDTGQAGCEEVEDNPYGEYNSAGLDPGYDSTTTVNNTSTTPNTQASTRTGSTSGLNIDTHLAKYRSHDRNSQSTASTEPATTSGTLKKRNVGRKSTRPKTNAEEEELKRNKFLERNRIAASKCRRKKKEWVSGLEDQKAGLESMNSNLQMEYHVLLEEIGGLKAELMTHASCDDPKINQWLENEARKFVQDTTDKLLSDSQTRRGSESRRHSSISSMSYQETGGGYANIDPMLRSADGSPVGGFKDEPEFSPAGQRDPGFEHASSIFGSDR